MLAVNERSFNEERFWGPNTIKPLNFNYDFTPNSTVQNIWTLTDGLFVPNEQRSSDDCKGQKALRVIYSRAEDRKTQSAKVKRNSRYQQFPTINENFCQKSSPPVRVQDFSKVKTSNSKRSTSPNSYSSEMKSWNSCIVSGRGSLSSRLTPSLDSSGSHWPLQPPLLDSSERRDPLSDLKETLGTKPKSIKLSKVKPFAKTMPNEYQKAQERGSVPGKLSLEETERLLKSLDFHVRTRKKVTTREQSKSDLVRKSPFSTTKKSSPAAKMSFQRRGIVGSATKQERFGIKNERTSSKIISTMSQNHLVRSSRKTSSSESSRKNSMSSTSGLGDLLGPLPRVKWTPELPAHKSHSSKKKSTEQSSVTLMKASKMKAVLKKAAVRDSPPSQDLSEAEGSSREVVTIRKVRTSPMKIIPKVTINNQLLKSTTSKNEKVLEKKVTPIPLNTASGKKQDSASGPLWTPDKIALLDKITSDHQLKTVLMSAGDTYMKSRRYGSYNNPRSVKAPQRATNAPKTPAITKPADLLRSPPKMNSVIAGPSGSSGKLNLKTVVLSNYSTEGARTAACFDSDDTDLKSTVNSKKIMVPRKFYKTKPDYTVKTVKPTVAVKNKAMKLSPKTGAGAQLVSGKKGTNSGAKRRQRLVTTAKERVAQMASEVVGTGRIQSGRMAQIRRSNLETLKKILDKTSSASNKLTKPEAVTSAKAN